MCQPDFIFGCEALIGLMRYPGVPPTPRRTGRAVLIDPDEVEGSADSLQLIVRELRSVLAGALQVSIGVSTLEHDRQKWRIELACCCLGSLNVLGRVGDRDGYITFADPTLVPRLLRARIACTERPCASTAWCRTWFSSAFESRARCKYAVGLTAADGDVHALMAVVGERAKLVKREVVPHSVAELFRDIPGIVGEGLRRVLRLPAAILVLQDLR